jgi:hypothetical protein
VRDGDDDDRDNENVDDNDNDGNEPGKPGMALSEAVASRRYSPGTGGPVSGS